MEVHGVRVAVFGLGYVGTVTAACLASRGHEVVGVDVNPAKVEALNTGKSPVHEAGVEELLRDALARGVIRATTVSQDAIDSAEIALVCVGTPARPNGAVDLEFVVRVCRDIGAAMRRIDGRFPVVVIRSTVPPHAIDTHVRPELEAASSKRAGVDFGLATNPEFLREGSAVADFNEASFTVVGADDEASRAALRCLYANVPAPFIATDIRVAQTVKYVCNAFHAVKITFGNEIGNVCKAIGIDGRDVMDIVVRDTKLNASAAYLKPGFAFGGSCLPKDLRALMHLARQADVELPMLGAVLPSNNLQVERALHMVTSRGRRRIGMLGLTFKEGTDDLRESPAVILAERLLGQGYELRIFDADLKVEDIVGANRSFANRALPHLAALMVTSERTLCEWAELLVVAKKSAWIGAAGAAVSLPVIDIAGLNPRTVRPADYEGICW